MGPAKAETIYASFSDVEEPEVLSIIPHIDLDKLRTLFFWLTFKRPHSGSGTNLTHSDVLDMEYDELRWYWDQLWRVWESEKT